jgi:RimJ/RimL family protein N-acetyltransferase
MNTLATQTPKGAILLGSQRWVTIRPIESSDRDGLFDFYQALSPGTRFSRFMGMGTGLPAKAAEQFARVDHRSADGLIAVLHEAGPADGSIVGHVCMEADGTGAEEVAIAVADAFRGHGIGTALMDGAVASAQHRGIPRLTATMFATNAAMRRLMLHTGARPIADRIDAGIESIELETAATGRGRGRRRYRE